MSYYDSSNKIRRRKVNSSNSHKNSIDSDIVTSRYKQENNKINRKKIDEDFELEKEIYYKKRDKKRRKRHQLIKRSLSVSLAVIFVATIVASLAVFISLKGSTKITKDLIYNSYVTENIVPVDEIPKDLKNAIIATEDKRFYEHGGVDIRSLTRSVVNNILTDSTQGGSTIDMQVSKNLLTCEDKTMKRKITDMYNAMQMNKIMTKDEILGAYLNNIYFGKDVRDLNLAQCAMLAGITNNPAKFMQHDAAKRRQAVVLNNMYKQGYITNEQYKDALSDPTPFKSEIA